MDPKQGSPPHIDTTGEGRETVGTRECHAPTMPCLSPNVMGFPGQINVIDTLSHGVIYDNTSRVMSYVCVLCVLRDLMVGDRFA